jgi:Tat protein secretion system quality control protein TatD with DNase activity
MLLKVRVLCSSTRIATSIFPDFKDDLDAVIARARDAGVKVMQTICTGMEEFDEVHGIAREI